MPLSGLSSGAIPLAPLGGSFVCEICNKDTGGSLAYELHKKAHHKDVENGRTRRRAPSGDRSDKHSQRDDDNSSTSSSSSDDDSDASSTASDSSTLSSVSDASDSTVDSDDVEQDLDDERSSAHLLAIWIN